MGQAIKKLGWKRNDIVVTTKVRFSECFPAVFADPVLEAHDAPSIHS